MAGPHPGPTDGPPCEHRVERGMLSYPCTLPRGHRDAGSGEAPEPCYAVEVPNSVRAWQAWWTAANSVRTAAPGPSAADVTPPGPYSIGSTVWPGLGKVVEETGELQQVLGKLVASGGATLHWDGTDLRDRLVAEVADVLAALEFLVRANDLPAAGLDAQAREKLSRFLEWHARALGAP